MTLGDLHFHGQNSTAALLAGVPMLLNMGIFAYGLRRLPRDSLSAAFLFYVACAMLWQGFDLAVRLAADEPTAAFLRGYLRLGPILAVFVGLHFTLLYAERGDLVNRWWFLTLLYAPPLLHLGGYQAGHWRESLVYHEGWGYLSDASVMGPVYQAHLAWGSLIALLSLGVLIVHTWRVRAMPCPRQASMILTTGMGIAVLGGVVCEAVLPLLGYHQLPLTSSFGFAFSLATVIGLSRYALFHVSTPTAAKALVETLTDPLFVIRSDGRLLYCNAEAGTSFGLDRERVQTYRLERLFPSPEQARAFREGPIQRVLDGAYLKGVEATLSLVGGTAPHLLSLAPVPFTRQGEPGVAVIAHDVGRLKQIEADLVDARDQAEFANRTKSEFLANMSHELRTPLNAIIGYAELLEEDAEDEAVAGDLERIRRSGRYLLDLINDVLDLSKVESGKLELRPERVEIVEALRALEPTFEQLVQRNANQLVLELGPAGHAVMADPIRLRQVLLNLVSNAAKFTERGAITISVSVDGPSTRFDVTDTGIGMDPEAAGRLFGMFTQVHRIDREKYGGTGLGLALSRRLCTLMDGDLVVHRTAPGDGSTFRMVLPSAPAD